MRGFRGSGIVGHHHDRFFVIRRQLAEQTEDLVAGFAIEVAGRFIRDDEPGIRDHGSGNRHPLFLTAGQFRRPMGGAIRQAHEVERGIDAFSPVGPRQGFVEEQGQLHVFKRGQNRHEMVELKNVAAVLRPPMRELATVHRRQIFAADFQLAGSRLIDSRDEVEQGGFSGTGRAHQGEKFPLVDGEAEILQRRHGETAFLVGLRQLTAFNERGGLHEFWDSS